MRRKILIGGILAVFLLTLVSFSNVVGYQSIKPNNKVISPLFNIRTNRAVSYEQNIIESDFIGKEDKLNIIFPKQNYDLSSIQRLIYQLQKEDIEEIKKQIQYLNEIVSNFDVISEEYNLKSPLFNSEVAPRFELATLDGSGLRIGCGLLLIFGMILGAPVVFLYLLSLSLYPRFPRLATIINSIYMPFVIILRDLYNYIFELELLN